MKKLLMLMCLPLLMVGCSKDNEEDILDGPDPVIPGENATDYIEFKSNMVPFTRGIVDDNTANKARLYVWGSSEYPRFFKYFLQGDSIETVAYTDLLYFHGIRKLLVQPDSIILTRSVDDPTMWDYSPKMCWSDHKDNPLSFFAIIEPSDCKYPLYFTGNSQPHEYGRNVKEIEFDKWNNEYYYSSGDLDDVMIAYSKDNCIDTIAESDIEKFPELKEVDLNFHHLFPRLVLNAKLGEENALEVNVNEAYIYGLHINGSHSTLHNESPNEAWKTKVSPLKQYVQMDLSQPLKLTSEFQPLVDNGHEPHVLPQQVKAWSAYANHDGAGIILSVNIRNMHDNSWIVGGNNQFELVYVPFPVQSLEAGKIYNIDIVFGAHYRDNGTAVGYQLKYQPEIVEWDSETENVELKKPTVR